MLKFIVVVLLLCTAVFTFSGCGIIDELRQEIESAEKELNASTKVWEKAQELEEKEREKVKEQQEKIQEKLSEVKESINSGDLANAQLLSQQLDALEAVLITKQQALDSAIKDNKEAVRARDSLKDLKELALKKAENSESPWDFLKGGIVLITSLFGGTGVIYGAKERVKRKIAEQIQLNPLSK